MGSTGYVRPRSGMWLVVSGSLFYAGQVRRGMPGIWVTERCLAKRYEHSRAQWYAACYWGAEAVPA